MLLAAALPGLYEEKLAIAFQLIDLKNTGYILKAEFVMVALAMSFTTDSKESLRAELIEVFQLHATDGRMTCDQFISAALKLQSLSSYLERCVVMLNEGPNITETEYDHVKRFKRGWMVVKTKELGLLTKNFTNWRNFYLVVQESRLMGYHTYESYAVRGPPSLLFLFSPKVKITCLQDTKGRRYLVLKNKKTYWFLVAKRDKLIFAWLKIFEDLVKHEKGII
ncbi:uncharacterized protein LOC135145031 [Zophobas morio]|jgi:hypothetical protein|uniref:uncharacterized protein LOC135145031 n=1 Tax=Zophobas morio TaxID=2755281 RepID=UPI0030834128